MIEQIRTGKTSRLLRAEELVLQIWTHPLITIPARGLWKRRIIKA
jgi:hypothetical protein